MSSQHISDNKHRKLIFTSVSIRNSYIPPKNAQKSMRMFLKRIRNKISSFDNNVPNIIFLCLLDSD